MTGLLTTCGAQFRDWSASYRLFSQQRIPVAALFQTVRRAVVKQLPPQAPVVAVLDDSLLRRAGLQTPGVGWRRDPLGPRFQTNFVRAQRFVQMSVNLPCGAGLQHMVPVSFTHAPTPPKPSRKAEPSAWQQYRAQARAARISQCGVTQIQHLREALDADPATPSRHLIVAFDGGYTNQTVLKQIPANTTCIGRVRKDAHLFFVPTESDRQARGRNPSYGAPAPTPEQVRTDDSAWEVLELTRNGSKHHVRFKRRTGLLWRNAGAQRVLQLVVIAPLGYRLRKNSKLLYRDPAFLLCTDPALDPHTIIEAYFQRWDIEVNFRDEKTLLGVGEAQVRSQSSVELEPAFAIASYAMLLVATERAFGESRKALLPRPRWAAPSSAARISTQQAINQLRSEVWARGLGLNHFSGFTTSTPNVANPDNYSFPLASAVCYSQA